MSRRSYMLLGLGAIAVATAGGAVADPMDADDLAAEVKTLREKVEDLEERLAMLEQARPGQSAVPSPAWESQPLHLPPGAQQRQFNGMTYYIIPTDGAGEAVATEAAPVVTVPAR